MFFLESEEKLHTPYLTLSIAYLDILTFGQLDWILPRNLIKNTNKLGLSCAKLR